MAKKKTKPAAQTPALSEKSYITSGRARKLPLYKCFINDDWQETGMANIFVARQHVNGNVTVGIYLADLFCAGVKSAFYLFNMSESEFNDLVKGTPLTFETCSYELAHNIIYGSIAYAEEFGIEPPAEFKIAQLILEEDTDDIPLMDIEFGKNGKPLLVINGFNPRNDYYLRQLEKNAGPGNYEVVRNDLLDDDRDGDEDDPDEDIPDVEAWDEMDWEDFLNQPDHRKDPDFLFAAFYIFEQAYPVPAEMEQVINKLLHPRPFEITLDSLPYDFYTVSEEEQAEIEKLHPLLKDPKTSKSQLKNVRDRLLLHIERWPGNPTFRNFLANTYIGLGEINLADETMIDTFRQIPEYFHGKIQYAQYLIRKGRTEEVLPLFNNQYTLPDIFPERAVFHYSEAVSFYSTMLSLFQATDQLFLAQIYATLFRNIASEQDEYLQRQPILELNMKILLDAEKIIADAKKAPDGIEKLINLLLQPLRLAPLYEEE